MIALRIYRALPKDIRFALIERLPPQRRLWLVRRLTRLPVGGRQAPLGADRRVRDAGRWRRARVVADATPAQAWQRQLTAVVDLFEAAGVPGFCVPHLDACRSAVAVPHRDRDRALAALRSALRPQGYVIEPVHANGRRTRRADVVRVYRPVTDSSGVTVLGREQACEVEFWRARGNGDGTPARLAAPRPNRVASEIPAQGSLVRVPPAALTALLRHGGDESVTYPTRVEFATAHVDDVTFPIDLVYTWVDGADPDWQARKGAALAALDNEPLNEVAANPSRYVSRDELRYSLRSVVAYAPWARHIYLVTDDQLPPWLDVDHPLITVVPHRRVFGATGRLPTFNSHAIESRLHLIPGLSEHFIYVNDDMFFGRPLTPAAFFHANGIAKFFPSPAQLDVGPPTVSDAPVTAAGKNNRMHIQRTFGRLITQKMRHVPYALRKSVLEEIATTLSEDVLATAGHQFRHPGDLSIPSSLQHYWGFLSGKAVPASIKYTYADLAHPSTPVQLASLLNRRHCDVFCLNDTDSAEVSVAEQHAMLAEFLQAYFPFRAPFELPDEVTRERSLLTSTGLWYEFGDPDRRPVRVPAQRLAAHHAVRQQA